MTHRGIVGTIADATLPRTPVTVGGKEYNLCFDLGALSEAETAINAEYIRMKRSERVNLLVALTDMNLSNTRILFAAAMRAFHPEIGFEEALALPTVSDLYMVVKAIEAAWMAGTVEHPSEPAVAAAGE
jgi:hypothetical protein